jgi:hypothetical protein
MRKTLRVLGWGVVVAGALALAASAWAYRTAVGYYETRWTPHTATFVVPFPLTSGEGSVTKGFTPSDWNHAVRHGLRHDLRSSAMPANELTNLSDRELSDIVAYIPSRPPVDRAMRPVELGPLLALALATDRDTH